MKISLEWLGDFLTWTEKDLHVIAERLTRSTAEIEEIEIQGKYLEYCCVAKIISLKKHPEADRLNLLEVETDQGMKQIVCGGTNLRDGMLVALAHVGATVKHGTDIVTLEAAKIRGQKSEGMICAAEELELSEMFPPKPEDGERPVIDLDRSSKKLKAGQPLREALGLNDVVFHISNTAITARPDLFSHAGFARECIALGLGKAKKRDDQRGHSWPQSKQRGLTMKVDCKDLVPRYLSCVIEADDLGTTPEWMKRRLEAVGIRSIYLPVDITNYVMMEMGLPMHSFDADDIRGTVEMRLSKKGEHLTTLDGKSYELPERCLILSDDEGVFDLIGIMGGLRSSTKATTRRMFLHGLSIDPVSIRRAIIGAGIRTDAATIYEKGVPPVTTEEGFYRALNLYLELIPGAKLVSAIDGHGTNGKAPTITINTDVVRATLGIDISDKEMVKILEDLECTVEKDPRSKSQDPKNSQLSTLNSQLIVTPPLHRLRDLTGPHDLIEEIGRIHGFDTVPTTMPYAPLRVPARDLRIHKLREELVHHGYWELAPLSLISPELLKRCNLSVDDAVHLKNPIGEETSVLQTSSLPQLLAHAERTLPRNESAMRTFQCSHVFDKKGHQTLSLGMLLCMKHDTGLLDDPFLTIKGEVLDAIGAMGHTIEIAPMKNAAAMAHPGRSAEIIFHGKPIGEIYEVHPTVRKRFGLPFRAAAVSLDMTALTATPSPVVAEKKSSAFPSVTYDVTVKRVMNDDTGSLLRKLRSASPLLESVNVQDIYEGKPLSDREFNLTLRFVYRAADRTLTEEEAKKEHTKVTALMA